MFDVLAALTDIAGVLMTILYFANILFAAFVIFFQKKNPSTTWAWLLVVFIVPYFGFIIYMLIGMDSRKNRRFARKAKEDDKLREDLIAGGIEGVRHIGAFSAERDAAAAIHVEGAERLNDLARMNHIAGGGTYSAGNAVTAYYNGRDKFAALHADIAAAKRFAHLMYFIIRDDDTGRALISALALAAGRGVEVKLLVDGMGSWATGERFYKPLRDAGGQVAVFWPPHVPARANFRNHRKACVIDGLVGYVGGFNVADEYLGLKKRFGDWRDTHLRIAGDAVKEIELRFMMDWNFAAPPAGRIAPSRAYFPRVDGRPGSVPMQIVCSGPDTKWDSIYFGYSKLITEADKSVYIQTPYFVPDANICENLRVAALSGIDVRVVIPAKPDHMFVHWASLSYLGELLDAGVRCYKYHGGFLHAKAIMIDGLAASVGTANMDVRSFKLNFEINAFLYDPFFCKGLEERFLKDLDDCVELTPEAYAKRGRVVKLKEAISRLLSPLL